MRVYCKTFLTSNPAPLASYPTWFICLPLGGRAYIGLGWRSSHWTVRLGEAPAVAVTWVSCAQVAVNVSHRSVSRVSDAEIASEILLVVSHLAIFLSHWISD